MALVVQPRKKSVVLDLDTADDRDKLLALIDGADIVGY